MNNPVERVLKYSPDALARFIRDNMRDLSKSNAHLTALFKDATALDERTKDLPDESVSYVLLNVLYRLVVEGKLNYKHINSMHFLNVMMFDKETELLNMLVSPDPDGWLVDRLHGHVKLPSVKLEELIDSREKAKDLHYESNVAVEASVVKTNLCCGWDVLQATSTPWSALLLTTCFIGTLFNIYSKESGQIVAVYRYGGVSVQNSVGLIEDFLVWSRLNPTFAIMLSHDIGSGYEPCLISDGESYHINKDIALKINKHWDNNLTSSRDVTLKYKGTLLPLDRILSTRHSIANITQLTIDLDGDETTPHTFVK